MSHINKLTSYFVCFILVSSVGTVFGQDEQKSDEKKEDIVREIVVPARPGDAGAQGEVRQVEENPEQYHVKHVAAPEPVPALKYRLYPSRGELKPGNSVPFYYRALVQLKNVSSGWQEPFYELLDELDGKPFDDYDDPEFQERVRRTHFPFSWIVSQLETAAYREETIWDWQMTQLEGAEPIMFLLPEIQESREIARILDVQSRLEAAQGNVEEALRLNLLAFKLGRDVAEPPTLINDLVGVAVSAITLATVRDIICQTDGPNLYWALATLPDPLISMNEGLEYESAMPFLMFPFLKDPEHEEHSPEEWTRLFRDTLAVLNDIGEGMDTPKEIRGLAAAGFMIRSYPIARRELAAAGWDRDKLEAMPVGQVLAIYQKRVTRMFYDESLKWGYLLFTDVQRIPRVQEEQDRFRRDRQRLREPIPLAQVLLPAAIQAKQAEVRQQSKILGLMVLEAIRMHAAANNGQLPKSLEEITIVPVPEKCPTTGEPYIYNYANGNASLVVPWAKNQEFLWWEFRLKSKP